MYGQLGVKRFEYNPRHQSNYQSLSQLETGYKSMFADDFKYVIPQAVYSEKRSNTKSIDLESQFFDKVKVPEQVNVVQRPEAKNGR